jgi:hypothetical protein
MKSRLWFTLPLVLLTLFGSIAGASAQLPSGERQLGQTIIEPGYDDRNGNLIYVMTPIGAPFFSKANRHAISPLYLIVYPMSAAGSVGTMNCAYNNGADDNCPDHGKLFADMAQANIPDVYGAGVWGHDHLMDGPGGSEFNVVWQIVVVLFTNSAAANTHITTEEQLDDAIEAGDAMTFNTPVTFNCNLVSAATYKRATPLVP